MPYGRHTVGGRDYPYDIGDRSGNGKSPGAKTKRVVVVRTPEGTIVKLFDAQL